VNPAASGFFGGGAFDGQYVYFGPSLYADLVRFDTRKSFRDPGAWFALTMDTVAVQVNPHAVLFDGRALYFPPAGNPPFVGLRYDTTASIGAKASWATFALDSVAPETFTGAASDGRFVYFAPRDDASDASQGQPGTKVPRFDTYGTFGDRSAWSVFDLTKANATGSFGGVVFDGRYAYFSPSPGSGLVRHDTRADFEAVASWATFDLRIIQDQLSDLSRPFFDGRYVLFCPRGGSIVARFDARAPH
jgi:hypothetical protein